MSDSEGVGALRLWVCWLPAASQLPPDMESAAGESWDFNSANERRVNHIAAARVDSVGTSLTKVQF